MQDIGIWVVTFVIAIFIVRCFYNFRYSKRVKKQVISRLRCLKKLNERVYLDTLAQFRKFNPDNYLKREINKERYTFYGILETIKFNEREIKELSYIFDNINHKHVSKSKIVFYHKKIMNQEYTSFKLIWNYTSPAGRNSYTNFNYYNRKKLENLIEEENDMVDDFIPMTKFEENWIKRKCGNEIVSGYQRKQMCGCYVILIFDYPTVSYEKFQNVYVGQSVNVYKRVHDHFNGKGNGDIYADAKYGKYLYVKIIPCEANEMNDLEKKLISFYESTKSYNKTAGGGIKRL